MTPTPLEWLALIVIVTVEALIIYGLALYLAHGWDDLLHLRNAVTLFWRRLTGRT